MIKCLHIKNFKCFEELSLPLESLTLLTGFNAAGKSTTLQTLLLLVQNIREGQRLELIPLNGSLVRLGTQGDVIRHGADSAISIGVEFNFQLALHVSPQIHRVDWVMASGDRRAIHTLNVSSINIKSPKFQNDVEDLLHLQHGPLSDNFNNPVFGRLSELLAQVVFISAMRKGTPDVFPSPNAAVPTWADVGSQGEFAAWWFEKLSDEDVDSARHHPQETAPSLRKQFNAWVSTLFPGAEANAQRIAGTSLVKLEFRNHGADEWRRPANIGYGLTYAFPILVAGLIAKPGQTIVIDSPEAHLHPKGQSLMGEFLAMLAHAGVQIIIETHSDHVLNGVRLAVNRGNMPSEDVAIHFFNPHPRSNTDPAHVTSPRMDANGGFSEWPQGFFDQAEQDLATLAGWK